MNNFLSSLTATCTGVSADTSKSETDIIETTPSTATVTTTASATATATEKTIHSMIDSLLERLEKNTIQSPNKEALLFLESGVNGGTIQKKFTYQDVWDETEILAENLLAQGIKQGDLAVLVYPPSLEFIIAFIACVKAGIVAVPVFPPLPSRRDTLVMFSTIVGACGATFALTNGNYSNMKKLSSLKDAFLNLGKSTIWPEHLTWIVTDSMSKKKLSSSSPLSTIISKHNDLAFLQFTSGSTSEPKGVMITQHNLADNLTKITNELKAGEDTTVVSWLPQYHDMGLIGSYLGILYCGGTGYYMSPLTFLQRPMMWIEAISRFRGTHIQAPNFAFKLTARKFDSSKYSKDNLDLSSLQHIINAAEPVTEESIDAFNEAFVPFGLKKEVMFPTYGLAEHTVFVCSGGKQRITVSKRALEVDGLVTLQNDSDINSTRMIGCGVPSQQNVDVKIVSTDTLKTLPQDKVGEIWIRSDSKARGYYKRPAISMNEFCAKIGVEPKEVNDDEIETYDPSTGYLRTGDLGFLHQGELFVCGRMKDLIIIGGRNYYPQDIEATAEATDARVRPGCSAAFTVDPISGGDEEVAIVLELREVPDTKNKQAICESIVEALRGAIFQEHSLTVSHIVLLVPKTVPKTSSGKIARARCRKGFLNNSLQTIYSKAYIVQKSSMEIEPTTGGDDTNGASAPNEPKVDPESIRRLSKKSIEKKLMKEIGKHVPIPPSSISKNHALTTMMDSLTLSQFKGVLEYEYATQLSDGYLFRSSTTISKLVDIVKLGYAPDDGEDTADGDGNDASPHGGIGESRGLAGALGCPPGVCCVVM
mmetsp:Transcript_28439/g.33085  ORF Transcript_28439/g.33085 Transcript_28439/m.33085 type:complete len:818 (-) Transcript_28439:80-2533(-)